MEKIWERYPGKYFPPVRRLNIVPPPPLSPEEVKRRNILADAYRNEKFLRRKAVECRKKWPGCEKLGIGKLVDAGKQGIIDAYKNYDPTREARLTTYAIKYIEHEMNSCLYNYAVRQTMESFDPRADEDNADEVIVSAEKLMETIVETLTDRPDRNHNIYTDRVEDVCFKKLRRDDVLQAISHLDAPCAAYMYYRDYLSPSKQRRESVNHFEISDGFAKMLEKESIVKLRVYLCQYGVGSSEEVI